MYILMGNTGEYSDHTTWFVAAYTSREMAEQHKKRLDEIIYSTEKEGYDHEDRNKLIFLIKAKELDPMCIIGYTGTWYEIKEVKLYRHFDEYLEDPNKISER